MNTQLNRVLKNMNAQLTKDLQSEVHFILASRIGGQTRINPSVLHLCINDLQCPVVVGHTKVTVGPV